MTRLTRIALIFALAAAMLAVSPSLFEPFVILKLVLVGAGLLVAWLGLFGRRLRPTELDAPLAALWAALLASAAVSTDWPVAVFGRYPQLFYGLLPLGLCTAAYYAVAATSNEEAPRELLGAMLAAAVPLSLYGVAQRFNADFLLHIPLPAGQRVYSTIGSPAFLGACLVPLIPVALHWALARKSALGWISGLSMCGALALTLSRGAWISAAAAAAFYLWTTGKLPRLRARHWGALASAAVVLLAVFEARYAKLKGDSMRWEIYRSAWPMLKQHPLLGWGPDNFLNAFRAHKTDEFLRITRRALDAHPNGHNDLIQAAVTLGTLGLLAYGWLLWRLAVSLRRRLARPGAGEAAALAAALLGLFIQAKVNPIPLTGLLTAAVMAGLACRMPERAPLRPAAGRAVCLLAAALCAANAAVWARFYAADKEFLAGVRLTRDKTLAAPGYMDGVNALRRATELNPWVIDYTRARLDVIFRVAGQVSPEQGRQLLEKGLAIATADESLHPGNASTHEMRATALELLKRFGVDRLAEALEETRIASRLDPTALFTMQRRMEIARALGDQAEFDRTLADYRRVISLTGENPVWEPLLK